MDFLFPPLTGAADVQGPGSAVTDNAVVRWDGTTGVLVQNSLLTISDVGAMALTATSTNAASLTLTSDVSAFISLVADTDNVTEADNAYIKYSQDGAGVIAWAGLNDVNKLPDGSAYTGLQANDFVIGCSTGSNCGISAITRVASANVISWQVNSTTGFQTFQCLAAGASMTGSSSGADIPYNFFNVATGASSTVTHFIGANATTLGISIRHNNNSGAATIDHYTAAGNLTIQTKQSMVIGIDSNNDTTNATFTIQKDAATTIWTVLENGAVTHTYSGTGTGPAYSLVMDSITTATGLSVTSNSSSASGRNLVTIVNDHVSATGATPLYIQQDSTAGAMAITTASTTTAGLTIAADALTTAGIASFTSNSADVSTRILVNIINDNTAATGTTPLNIQQDALTSTNFQKIANFGGSIFWRSDGTTPNGNLTGTAGDLCVNGASNQSYYCTGTTNWTALGGGSTGPAIFAQTATVTVANTVALTTIVGSGSGSATLNANTLTAGKSYRITASGIYSSTATPTLGLTLKFGSTTLSTQSAVNVGAQTNMSWSCVFWVTCRSTGGSGTVFTQGYALYSQPTASASLYSDGATASTVTVDTTASASFDVLVAWDTASASNSFKCTNLTIEALN